MVLTLVLAEICMSAGPKSVAPVSRPLTVAIVLIIRCSMKGRTTVMQTGIQIPAATALFRSSGVSATSLFFSCSRILVAADSAFWTTPALSTSGPLGRLSLNSSRSPTSRLIWSEPVVLAPVA